MSVIFYNTAESQNILCTQDSLYCTRPFKLTATRMNTEIIRILLVDDHVMLRKGIVLLLSEEADITVVGETGDGEEAILQVHSLKPDIVLIENSMPKLNGIEVTQQIIAELPHCKVIAFSTHSAKHYVDDMLNAGAAGYLLKKSDPEELLEGIHAVMRGEIFLSNAVNNTVLEAYVEQIAKAKPEKEDICILRTKLHSPPMVAGLISRPHLIENLNAGRVQPLILVSAPAGYGKSILISSWLKFSDWPSSWVSLDQSDSDLHQFLVYFLTAIEDIFPASCKKTLSMLYAAQLPSISILVTSLSNELEMIKQPFFLVLDDFYRVNTQSPVNELINLLLERPPLPLHLVIITRRDPPIPLVTLRAKDQLTEIRIQELCFTLEETKLLLEESASFTASNDVLDNLHREIEGWVVGLRLVSQILRSNNNQQVFLQNLNGGVQQTNEYLLHEVFTRQTPHIQKYMLQSSILNRFCAPLCEAISQFDNKNSTSELNAEKFINELREGNLFAISLDSQSNWFRFHHLFQQLLQNELTKHLTSNEIADLHVRAAQWFETQGLIDEAIEHSLAAGDVISAAGIIERAYWGGNQDSYGWQSLEKWLSMLPAEIKEQRPYLLLSQVHILFVRYQLNEIAPMLKKLELITMDKVCIGMFKLFQGALYYWSGEGKKALKLHLEVKKIIPETYSAIMGINEIYIAMASQIVNHEKALSLSNETIEHRNRHNIVLSAWQFLARAFLHMFCGQLSLAKQDAKRVNKILFNSSLACEGDLIRGWGRYMEASSYFRLNNLALAEKHFSILVRDKHSIHRRAAIDAMIGLALTQQAMHQSDTAIDIMEELLEFTKDFEQSEYLFAVQSAQARLALAQGDLNSAVEWLQSFNEQVSAVSMFLWLENPVITQARVLLAIAKPDALQQAGKILTSVQQETEALHNTCQLIEVMVLQVLLLDKSGSSTEAMTTLEKVINLTEPEGWISSFVEAGPLMLKILERFAEQTAHTQYLSFLIEKCKSALVQTTDTATNHSQVLSINSSWKGEALTNREIDILELLTQRMQNKEMAAKLFVSAETIKTHLKHLYQKLDVNNRREAAAIAQDIIFPKS